LRFFRGCGTFGVKVESRRHEFFMSAALVFGEKDGVEARRIAMTDEEIIERFAAGTLPAADFHHREHVRLAWLHLKKLPVADALAALSAGLRRMAQAHGRPEKYHETVTWAYALLIRERMARTGEGSSWQEFAASNADVLEWEGAGPLKAYYREETLRSDLARQIFVFPDKIQ
jgi:hypothetical protein